MKHRNRIARWWLIGSLTLLSVCGASCTRTRMILIPAGTPVMLAEKVWAKVYVKVDGKLVKSPNRVKIPAGWWCLPDDGE